MTNNTFEGYHKENGERTPQRTTIFSFKGYFKHGPRIKFKYEK